MARRNFKRIIRKSTKWVIRHLVKCLIHPILACRKIKRVMQAAVSRGVFLLESLEYFLSEHTRVKSFSKKFIGYFDRKKFVKVVAASMSVMLVLTMLIGPFSMAEEAWDEAKVTEFVTLPEGVLTQFLDVGAVETDIYFPTSLNGTISIGEEELDKDELEEDEELDEEIDEEKEELDKEDEVIDPDEDISDLENKEDIVLPEQTETKEGENNNESQQTQGIEPANSDVINEGSATENVGGNAEQTAPVQPAEGDVVAGGEAGGTGSGNESDGQGSSESGVTGGMGQDVTSGQNSESNQQAETNADTSPNMAPASDTQESQNTNVSPEASNQSAAPEASMASPAPAAYQAPVAPDPAASSAPASNEGASESSGSGSIDIGAIFRKGLFGALTASAEVQTKDVNFEVTAWKLDIANSSMPVFESTIIGNRFVYVPEIVSEYPLATDLPKITVVIGQEEEELLVAFEQSVNIDGVTITLQAEEGVFPEGASLFARKLSDAENENVNSIVGEHIADQPVVAAYNFDIKVLDAGATEIQPDTTRGKVRLSFAVDQAASEEIIPEIIHINEETNAAEQMVIEHSEQVVSTEVTSFSPYSFLLLGAGADVMDNDGYPYGFDLNLALCLKMKLIDGTDPAATTFQWQSSSDNTNFTDIENATEQIYKTASATSGTWFRCVVNGHESKSVQAVGVMPRTDNYIDFEGKTWTRTMDMAKWYITNGTMAYSRISNGDIDFAGRYNKNGKTYMIQTSCDNQQRPWRVYSSAEASPTSVQYNSSMKAQLDDMYFAFNEGSPRTVVVAPDLQEGQRSFALMVDAELGGSEFTGGPAGSGVLDIYRNSDNTFKGVSLIGARTIANITNESPEFGVLTNDPSVKFYFCDQMYQVMVNTYNTLQSGVGFLKEGVVVDGVNRTDIVTKLDGKHNAMSMTWTNIPSGGTIKFYFGLGLAGAVFSELECKAQYDDEVIEDLSPNTTYHITIGNNSKEYEFVLGDGETTIPLEREATDTVEGYSFLGKNICVTDKAGNKKKNLSIASRPIAVDGSQEITTREVASPEQAIQLEAIDPSNPNEVIVKTGNSVIKPQKYRIYDKDGQEMTGYDWTDPTSGKVTFTGLPTATNGNEFYVKSYIPAVRYEYPKSLESPGLKVLADSIINLTYDEDFVIQYDGEPHDFSIKTEPDDAVVEYAYELNQEYTDNKPIYTNVINKKRVYYKASKSGYYTVYGSYTVTIKPKPGTDVERETKKLSINEDPRDEIERVKDEYLAENGNVETARPNEDQPYDDAFLFTIKRDNYLDYNLKVIILCKAPHEDVTRETELLEYDAKLDYNKYVDAYLDEVRDKEPGINAAPKEGGNPNEFTISGDDYESYTLTIIEKRKDPPPEPEPEPEPEPKPGNPAPEPVFDYPDNVMTKPYEGPAIMTSVSEPKPTEPQRRTVTRTAIVRRPQAAAPVENEEEITEPVIQPGNILVSMKLADADRTNAAFTNSEEVADKVLNEEQKAVVNNGSTIEIKVETSPVEIESISDDEKEIIDTGIKKLKEQISNLAVGNYIDISMFLRVDESDWARITQTNEPIGITIDIPEDLRGISEEYYVLRLHEGKVDLLEDLDENPDTVTISTGMFSTYAIMYAAEELIPAAPEPEEDACSICHMCPTFLGICYFIWLLILLAVVVTLALIRKLRKNYLKQKELDEY